MAKETRSFAVIGLGAFGSTVAAQLGSCCRDRPSADIEVVGSFQDALNATQIQRRSS